VSSSIFYSWQGDRPSRVCRNLIENALRDAVERIAADTTIEAAIRDGVEVDKDTKNVPGSPAIFDTILEKIANASIVVPDLTFVGQRENGKQIPNPNVLIEYGFALSNPGPSRIVGVMNTAFGQPTSENMPFNLAHRRFPIQYELREEDAADKQKQVRQSLSKDLGHAIKLIFGSEEFQKLKLPPTPRPRTAMDEAMDHAEMFGMKTKEVDSITGTGWKQSIQMFSNFSKWLRRSAPKSTHLDRCIST
jgi:hypothetical protein